jgi:hypothetical protein
MLTKSLSKEKPRVYGPANFCIYCGRKEDGLALTREHIIPIGLGGGLVFLKASCDDCRNITREIETTCLRKMLLPYRLYAGMVRHADDLPKHVPLMFSAGPQRAGIPIPLFDHPTILVMPHFLEPPGLLIGKAPDTRLNLLYQIIGDRQLHDTMQKVIADKTIVSLHFDISAFMKMLAKIAHSFAVAEVGLENFDPMLMDLLFGRNLALASNLIGLSTNPMPIPENLRHQIAWGALPWARQWVVGVRIRLFAAHSTTQAYTVVAGVLNPDAVTRYKLA